MDKEAIVFLGNEHSIVYDGKEPKFTNGEEQKQLFSALLIPLKYLHSFSFKISNSVSDDELTMQAELKMYKEGGLDVQKEYAIDFIKYDLGDEYLVEAFALAKDDFDNYIEDFSYKVNVVDLAFPRFIAYEVRYKTDAKKSNDVYIYISNNEAFAAIYQDGKYIGHRIINSLSALSKRTGLELVKLKAYLKEKGLKRENYDLEESLILDAILEVFSKDIEKIVYSINHKRGIFGLTGIDKVYIDYNGNTLEGLEELFTQYGFSPTIEPLPPLSTGEPQLQSLSILLNYALNLHNGVHYSTINLTHLARKKPLIEYAAFRYLIETLLIIIVIFGSYLFVSHYLNAQKAKITHLDTKVKEQKKKLQVLSLQLKKIKKKNNVLAKEKKGLEDKIFVYDTTFRVIPMIKQISIKRQKMMNDIISVLKKYRLSVSLMLQKDEKSFEISLISKENRRSDISKFMQDLLQLGYKNVMTKDIAYENDVYKSKIYINEEEEKNVKK